jgi:molybdenum cofactor synthesis domain-containing protein
MCYVVAMTDAAPTAAVLIIGNEILSGRTQDANLNTIAKKLAAAGIRLAEARVVPDIEDRIIAAVNELRAAYTYLFTTGGIGPTHDDITAATVAKAYGVALIDHPEAVARLTAYYTPANLNPARLRMALIPEGAGLIDNPVSAAPGFHLGNVYVMAGVPNIMTAMLDNVVATLQHGPAIIAVTVSSSVPESVLAADLAAIAARYPDLDIGSYPSFRMGQIGLALVARGTDRALLQQAADDLAAMIRGHGGNALIFHGSGINLRL